jgi:hypothetical protein
MPKRSIDIDNLLATSHAIIGQDAPSAATRSYHVARRRVEASLRQGKIFPDVAVEPRPDQTVP